MTVYCLTYVNECHRDCEHEFEAIDDDVALSYAQAYTRGNEGLWTGIDLTNEHGTELIPFDGWF